MKFHQYLGKKIHQRKKKKITFSELRLFKLYGKKKLVN